MRYCNIDVAMGEGDGYRLAPVRDVRARQQRVREGDLAGAVGDARSARTALDAATVQVNAARAAIEDAREQLAARLAHGATSAAILRAERHLARLRRDLEGVLAAQARADAAHRGQLAEVDAARERLTVARAEKELIERHFARWRQERTKLADRRED